MDVAEPPTTFVAEALTLRGGADGDLISDLSLSARSGEVLAITGPSGSGKSSLLHVLGGLVEPDAGRLLLDGRPVSLWRDSALGLILQNLHLMPVLTAHEAVALPLQARRVGGAETGERASRALDTVGLHEQSNQLVSELSGGQRQRVAIARALAGEPDLILADEPTAALDPHWRSVVLEELVGAARAGAIVIIASSDPELIERCDQVITLS